MDITKLSLIELKALAYDTISKIEMETKNLQIVNAKITQLTTLTEEVVEAEEKTETL